MHPHRVDVLDRAHDHHVVRTVAHHLQLELTPPQHRLVEQHLPDRRGLQAPRDDRAELLRRTRDPTATASQGVGGAHDARQADVRQRVQRLRETTLDVYATELLVPARGDRAGRHAQPRLGHRCAEQLAVLRAGDRLVVGADQLHSMALQRAIVVQRLGEVQRGLPAEGGKQCVGALALDHLRRRPRQQRLDVRRVRQLRIGHDRRRVGVHQDHLVALLAQHLARLHTGVVKLGGLSDHDRTRAQDQDAVDVLTPWHQHAPRSSTNSPFPDPPCGGPL